MRSTMIENTAFSVRDMITGLLSSFYILDYGFVNKVNADGSVNVTHAKKHETLEGIKLPETTTNNIEVLTLSGAGFSVVWDIQPGDQVLLLGLKDYVPQVGKVTRATDQEAFIHYTRDTMKAFPLSVFNKDAKVVVQVDKGTLKVDTEKKIELNGNTSHLVTYEELNTALQDMWTLIKGHGHSVTVGQQSGTASASSTLQTTLDISGAKAGKVTTKAGT